MNLRHLIQSRDGQRGIYPSDSTPGGWVPYTGVKDERNSSVTRYRPADLPVIVGETAAREWLGNYQPPRHGEH